MSASAQARCCMYSFGIGNDNFPSGLLLKQFYRTRSERLGNEDSHVLVLGIKLKIQDNKRWLYSIRSKPT